MRVFPVRFSRTESLRRMKLRPMKTSIIRAAVLASLLSLRFPFLNVPVLAGECTAPSFAAARALDAGGTPRSVAVADFNHDGNADLAVATSDGLSVLLGKGDGTFQTVTNYTVD